MNKLKKIRKVELFKDDKWIEIQLNQIKIDDKFRMFEPNGNPVVGIDYTTEWKATMLPFEMDGIWTIYVDCTGLDIKI